MALTSGSVARWARWVEGEASPDVPSSHRLETQHPQAAIVGGRGPAHDQGAGSAEQLDRLRQPPVGDGGEQGVGPLEEGAPHPVAGPRVGGGNGAGNGRRHGRGLRVVGRQGPAPAPVLERLAEGPEGPAVAEAGVVATQGGPVEGAGAVGGGRPPTLSQGQVGVAGPGPAGRTAHGEVGLGVPVEGDGCVRPGEVRDDDQGHHGHRRLTGALDHVSVLDRARGAERRRHHRQDRDHERPQQRPAHAPAMMTDPAALCAAAGAGRSAESGPSALSAPGPVGHLVRYGDRPQRYGGPVP